MLLHQIRLAGAKYFEGTINPSNKASEHNYQKIAQLLNTQYQVKMLFSEEDFGNDGHEAEVLYRIGPINTAS
jgi:L-2,4-diaminobutyric acid acetyltransferase